MNRPNVEKYGELADSGQFDGVAASVATNMVIPELCAYVKHLEAIIRDWCGLCAQACGGSDECVERAEKVLPLPFTDEEEEVL